jgi:molybdenum cofactor cytidylyltransferase
MIFAVVPACGQSSRMGRPKLSLPLGTCTVIEHVIVALRSGGVEQVLVVVGPHVPELVPLALAAGAEVLEVPEVTSDMRATVERGLAYLEEHFHPQPDDWWMLAPADQPILSAAVVRDLIAATISPLHNIIIPVHGEKRGHPTLIRWRKVAEIRAMPPDRGINSFLRAHAQETLELPISDPGILSDLDTPEDYARQLAHLPRPTET